MFISISPEYRCIPHAFLDALFSATKKMFENVLTQGCYTPLLNHTRNPLDSRSYLCFGHLLQVTKEIFTVLPWQAQQRHAPDEFTTSTGCSGAVGGTPPDVFFEVSGFAEAVVFKKFWKKAGDTRTGCHKKSWTTTTFQRISADMFVPCFVCCFEISLKTDLSSQGTKFPARHLWPCKSLNIQISNMYCNSVEYDKVKIPPGARVRPPTNYWVSYQPTIGYLTNQLLGILPTNLQHSFYQFFAPPPPPWQPMLLMIQVQVQHSFYQCFPPLGNPCLVLGFRF